MPGDAIQHGRLSQNCQPLEPQRLQGLGRGLRPQGQIEQRRRGEALVNSMAQQIKQRLPIAFRVQKHGFHGKQSKIGPAQHLDHFLQRADAARQDHETGAFQRHAGLALVQCIDNFKGAVIKSDFIGGQKPRDNTQNLAPLPARGAGGNPHQANAAAAIDQTQAAGSDFTAQFIG